MKKQFPILILLVLVLGCGNKEEDFIRIDAYDKQVIDYFSQVALGFSDGSINQITRKWNTPMIVYMNDKASKALKDELVKVVDEINELSTDGFEMEITADSLLSNFDIFIGTAKEYYKIYPSQGDTTSTFTGNYFIYWHNKSDIFYGNMFIDQSQQNTTYHTFLLRRLLTGAIGLTNQGYLYEQSIFYTGWMVVNKYHRIDRDMIRLLYHPDIQTGWNAEVVRTKVLNILLNEK